MRIQYTPGPERKKLAAAVANHLGTDSRYQGMPSAAYIVGMNYTISRDGALIGPDDPGLVEILAAQGFEPTEEVYDDTPAEQPERLTVEVPIDDSFTPAKMDNLEKLIASRDTLLKKVLGTDTLPVEQTPNSLKFDWFPEDGNAMVYSQLASALVRVATEATRITAREKPVESEKFRMRTMLLRLGFIGPEFSQARKILTQGLSGSGSQVAESARSLLPPQQTETMSFYFPLAINIEDEDGNLKEGDRFLRLEVEDDICAVLRDSAPEGENMARHMGRCSQALRDKVASAVWDAGKYGGDVYGVVRCELRAPLTAAEKQELAGWIRLQNVGGIGETAEQLLIQTEYQELYLSFNCNGYSVFDQKQFEDHINGHTPEMEPDQITFYCPLTVQLYDDGDESCEDLVEVDNCYLDCHEDKVRAGLRACTGDINMADYLDDGLKEKVSSVEWDIEKVGDTVYGKITCGLRAPLTSDEQNELASWICGQNSDGLGEVWEQHPVKTSDGNLYISLWHSGADYYVLPENEFQTQVLGQSFEAQGMGAMGGMS